MIYANDVCSNNGCARRGGCERWIRFNNGNIGDNNVIRSCMGYIAFVPSNKIHYEGIEF